MSRYVYVNIYETDRAYGGPEEGGWYYDVGTPVKTMPVARDRAERLLGRVREVCDRLNRDEQRKPGWSVLATGDYLQACIEEQPGEQYPRQRPRYE